jgi:hypothetical protein
MAESPQTHPGTLNTTVLIAAFDGVGKLKRSAVKAATTTKTATPRLAIPLPSFFNVI